MKKKFGKIGKGFRKGFKGMGKGFKKFGKKFGKGAFKVVKLYGKTYVKVGKFALKVAKGVAKGAKALSRMVAYVISIFGDSCQTCANLGYGAIMWAIKKFKSKTRGGRRVKPRPTKLSHRQM